MKLFLKREKTVQLKKHPSLLLPVLGEDSNTCQQVIGKRTLWFTAHRDVCLWLYKHILLFYTLKGGNDQILTLCFRFLEAVLNEYSSW